MKSGLIVEKPSIKIEWKSMDLNTSKDKAAVMIILCENGEIEALYIKRASNPMDPWSGQIAFPGGRTKIQDIDIIETAIRETREEVGIEVKREDVIGILGVFQLASEPKLKVYPVIVKLNFKPKVKLSNEVTDYMWIPIKRLCLSELEINGKKVEGYKYGSYIIWGLTARITKKLIELLKQEDLYTNNFTLH